MSGIERYGFWFGFWFLLMILAGLIVQPGFFQGATTLYFETSIPARVLHQTPYALLFFIEKVFWATGILLCSFVSFSWAVNQLNLPKTLFLYGAGIACVCVVVKNIFIPPALPEQGYGLMLALNAVSEYLYFMVGEAIGLLLVLALKSLLLLLFNPNGKRNGHKNAKHSPEDMTMLIRLLHALCSIGSTKTKHPTKKNKKASSHVN